MITLIAILFAMAAGIFAKTAFLWHERNVLKAEADTLTEEIENDGLRSVIFERKDLWR